MKLKLNMKKKCFFKKVLISIFQYSNIFVQFCTGWYVGTNVEILHHYK